MSYPPSTPPPPPPPGPTGPGRLYSVIELAQLWACTPRHIYNLIAAGDLATVNLARGKAKTRIPATEVEAYIERHLVRRRRPLRSVA